LLFKQLSCKILISDIFCTFIISHRIIAREGILSMNIIKVSGTSRTSAVAGAIAGVFRDNKRAEVQAIGAIAVNQAVKALALARGYLREDGYDIVFTPEFVDVTIDDKIRTAIRFNVEAR
jgi:stage V sporulation protein S